MNEIREIVTKAIVGKGKKLIRLSNTLTPVNEAYSVLGCWIINHEFEATLDETRVSLTGTYEINVWYAYDNNTRTDIVKEVCSYSRVIRTCQIVQEVNSDRRDVVVRILQQPICVNAEINDNTINVDVVLEVLAEIIGETKIKVTIFNQMECQEQYEDDDFENEINENFINEE